ncbi:MAG: hypothetical protein ACO1N5_15230 [Noviherbaspirillum sp.]
MMAARWQAKGFSLVETMVASCVLAVGVIGSASLHAGVWRTTRFTAEQGIALAFAAELAERMLAGSRAAAEELTQSSPRNADAAAVAEWHSRLAESLPGGHARICRDAQPWDEGAAAWRWECDAGQGGEAPLMIKIGWRQAGEAPGMVLAVAP